MKKVVLALALVAGLVAINACTAESTDEQIEILSPDKDTCPPGGCPQ